MSILNDYKTLSPTPLEQITLLNYEFMDYKTENQIFTMFREPVGPIIRHITIGLEVHLWEEYLK